MTQDKTKKQDVTKRYNGKHPEEKGVSMQRQSAPPARQGWSDPFRQMRSEFDRLFDRFLPAWPNQWEARDRSDFWGLDIDDRDDAVIVEAEAPGFDAGDFELDVRGNQLVLTASHEEEQGEEGRGHREWRQQQFSRVVTLPADVDAEKVEAHYRNGMLTVKMPKTQPSPRKRIAVQG